MMRALWGMGKLDCVGLLLTLSRSTSPDVTAGSPALDSAGSAGSATSGGTRSRSASTDLSANVKPPAKLLRKLSRPLNVGSGKVWAAGKASIVGSGRLDCDDPQAYSASAAEAHELRAELMGHAEEVTAMLSALGLSHVKVCVEDPTDEGQTAAQHMRALYEEAPPMGVSLVLTSTTTAAAAFCRHHPQMFCERTVRVVHMGGALLKAEMEDNEPTGAMGLEPDPAAQNNRLDMQSADELYEEAQRLSVPMTILSRHVAKACRVPSALFDLLGAQGGEMGETIRHEQVEAVESLYQRACSDSSEERHGLPWRCNREWFTNTFCQGAKVEEGEPVWGKIDSINLYNPLALLAALPAVEERYLIETSVTVRSATHHIIGICPEDGTGVCVRAGQLGALRSLIYHSLFYGLSANASDFEPRDHTRTALPLHFSAERKAVDQPNPERAWVYDPAASPDTLDALLAAKPPCEDSLVIAPSVVSAHRGPSGVLGS